jgi:hypothetical protein
LVGTRPDKPPRFRGARLAINGWRDNRAEKTENRVKKALLVLAGMGALL